MRTLNDEIGSDGYSALAIFLRACLFESKVGVSPLRAAVRAFLDSANTADSLERLRSSVTQQAISAASAELAAGEARGYRLLPFFAPDFPPELLELPEPPASLWLWGALPPPPRIAVVGSRAASPEGLRFARGLGARLAEAGVPVVSGLARGIDSAAHQGAVAGVGSGSGRSAGLAILGSGLLSLYPRENLRLALELVAAGGGVISEYRLNQAPQAFVFPDRNRLISALGCRTVVVEAGERSGSLITANLAANLGRELFVVPGNVERPEWRGSNSLLEKGARALVDVERIEALFPEGWDRRPRKGKERSADSAKALCGIFEDDESRQLASAVLECCRSERTLDELSDALGFRLEELLAVLTRLEISGVLLRRPEGAWMTVPELASRRRSKPRCVGLRDGLRKGRTAE